MLESTMMLMSDDPALIEIAGRICQSIENLNFAVLPEINGVEEVESWKDVVLVLIHQTNRDLSMPIERFLRKIAMARRPTPTLVVSDHYDSDQALSLLRLGLADYVESSIDSDRLATLLDVLTLRTRLTRRPVLGPKKGSSPLDSELIDDDSPAMVEMLRQVRMVASQDTTILISGETGTGKSKLARRIHDLSDRRDEPFVVVNCGSLAITRIETEMFGHVRGVFPSADRDHPGKFGEVGRGTLFLDEIDALPMVIQSRLLRVIEDRVFEPVGSHQTLPVQARLIAASNRVLEMEVEADRFRSDLYYRLNVVGFQICPLRDRRGSIPRLVDRFLGEFSDRMGRPVPRLSVEAFEFLMDYDWPGNIRELRNVIERAVTLSANPVIDVEDLPSNLTRGTSWDELAGQPEPLPMIPSVVTRSTLAQTKKDAELIRITEALEKHGHNRLRTAGELGISRMTLYKKLYKYGLMRPDGIRQDGFA